MVLFSRGTQQRNRKENLIAKACDAVSVQETEERYMLM